MFVGGLNSLRQLLNVSHAPYFPSVLRHNVIDVIMLCAEGLESPDFFRQFQTDHRFFQDDTCRHTRDDDSDTDLCLDESDFNFERTNSLTQASQALVNHVYYIEK